ncbi:MAG: hypothetical protein LC685_04800, partial [Actinobacteria bacterium]|nr:hypothetical protein [Actinomycetota bacterium]
GITVRYLAAQAPVRPVAARGLFDVFVDARGKRYAWSLRRLGTRRPLHAGVQVAARLRLRAPAGPGGLYVVDLRSAGHTAQALVPVSGPHRRDVLVVLPAISWQGSNPADDDGDGEPDTLGGSGTAALDRPLVPAGLPAGFDRQEGPLLSWLDHRGLRYELTTDAGLLGVTDERTLARHRGVVLAGDEHWLPEPLRRALAGYVRAGGHVASFGTDSLRRTVVLDGRRLVRPSAPATTDVFGAHLQAVIRRPISLLAFARDAVGLFAGTDGLFKGFGAFEGTASIGRGARLAAGAGEQEGRPVIVAYRLGRGLVIRTGLPEWTSRLASTPSVATVTRRIWALLSR